MNEAVENNTIVKTGAPKKPFQGKNIGIYARKNARGGIHIYIRTNIGKEYCTVVEGSTADEKKSHFMSPNNKNNMIIKLYFTVLLLLRGRSFNPRKRM